MAPCSVCPNAEASSMLELPRAGGVKSKRSALQPRPSQVQARVRPRRGQASFKLARSPASLRLVTSDGPFPQARGLGEPPSHDSGSWRPRRAGAVGRWPQPTAPVDPGLPRPKGPLPGVCRHLAFSVLTNQGPWSQRPVPLSDRDSDGGPRTQAHAQRELHLKGGGCACTGLGIRNGGCAHGRAIWPCPSIPVAT
jgi:hypothetical protein